MFPCTGSIGILRAGRLDTMSAAPSNHTPRRRIFVGDVQGCADELDALLDRVAFSAPDDALYFVGDLVNRGRQSRRVLDLAERYASGIVLGNHEYWLLQRRFFDAAHVDPTAWRGIPDLAADPERPRFAAWIRSWPLLLDLGDVWLVHAALPPALWSDDAEAASLWTRKRLHPEHGLDDDELFVLHARYCNSAGKRPAKDWPPPNAPYRPWDEFYSGARTVVFGHWARRGLVLGDRVRGLDSGCVYGGSLSAWIAESDEIVQVPARRAYWPR